MTALMRALPKELRRPLVPVPETAAQVLERARAAARAAARGAWRASSSALRGVRVPRAAWDLDRLPPHLRDDVPRRGRASGGVLAEGNDLDARARAGCGRGCAPSSPPPTRAARAHGPADLDDRHAAARGHAAGHRPGRARVPGAGRRGRDRRRARARDARPRSARRCAPARAGCCCSPCPRRCATCSDRLGNAAQLALAAAPHGSVAAVLDDAVAAAVDALIAEAGGPAWDEAAFARAARPRRRATLAERDRARSSAAWSRILDAAREVAARARAR